MESFSGDEVGKGRGIGGFFSGGRGGKSQGVPNFVKSCDLMHL